MKSSFKFALVVFAPLLVLLLIPAPCLGINCILVLLIYISDPNGLPASEVAGYCGWSLAPILLIGIILVTGMFCYALYRRWRATFLAWVCVWLCFSVFLFLATWFGFSMLTSVGASDYSAQNFFTWTASVAVALTLLAQIAVIPWLAIASRICRANL